jgi:hypothetical protein
MNPNRVCDPKSLTFSRYRILFPGGKKQPKQEAGHSPPSNVKVKNKWRYNSSLPYSYVLCIWTTREIKQRKTMCLFSVNRKVLGSFCHSWSHVSSQPVYRCCSATQHDYGTCVCTYRVQQKAARVVLCFALRY